MSAARKKSKVRELGQCCPVMALVLTREHRFGIRVDTMFSFTGGEPTRQVITVHFPMAKDRKEPHASSTYAPFNFCPFCGAELS